MLDFAMIIPCYNEEKDIKDVLTTLRSVLKQFNNTVYKVYIYNNNSTDHTVEKVNEFIKENSDFSECIELKTELKAGKGNVIKSAFKEINAKYYGMCDGDNTYDISTLHELYLKAVNENIDMLIGDRLSTTYFKENKRLSGNIGNKLIKFIINTVFKTDYSDILSGYRIFSNNFVKSIDIKSEGFDIETELSIFAAVNHFKTVSLPIEYQDRKESVSKLRTIPDGYKILSRATKMIIAVYSAA